MFRGRNCADSQRAAHTKSARHIECMQRTGHHFPVHFCVRAAHQTSAAHWECARHVEPFTLHSSLFFDFSIQIIFLTALSYILQFRSGPHMNWTRMIYPVFESEVERHPKNVFFYQDSSDTGSFILGIQTEWKLQQMIRFGNNSLIAADTTFEINKLKYPL